MDRMLIGWTAGPAGLLAARLALAGYRKRCERLWAEKDARDEAERTTRYQSVIDCHKDACARCPSSATGECADIQIFRNVTGLYPQAASHL